MNPASGCPDNCIHKEHHNSLCCCYGGSHFLYLVRRYYILILTLLNRRHWVVQPNPQGNDLPRYAGVWAVLRRAKAHCRGNPISCLCPLGMTSAYRHVARNHRQNPEECCVILPIIPKNAPCSLSHINLQIGKQINYAVILSEAERSRRIPAQNGLQITTKRVDPSTRLRLARDDNTFPFPRTIIKCEMLQASCQYRKPGRMHPRETFRREASPFLIEFTEIHDKMISEKL